MSDDRCGYVTSANPANDDAVCCWRPVFENRERCFWHTDGEKSPEALERHRPAPDERLDSANLRGAVLTDVSWLAGHRLSSADFTDATLRGVDLTGSDLRQATFRGVDARNARFDQVCLKDAAFIHADLRGTTLGGAQLSRAAFTDVRVDRDTDFGDCVEERTNGNDTSREGQARRFDAASRTYRELQRLFESDAMPRRARRCYLGEREMRRRAAWARREYLRALTLEGSRWVMRYGMGPWRVITSSVVVILVCALAYPLTGGVQEVGGGVYELTTSQPEPLRRISLVFFKGLYFSVTTFTTVGYGDMQPIGTWARGIAGVEALLGSLLMALLVFVLTRRVGSRS